jgi:hypothetical protein
MVQDTKHGPHDTKDATKFTEQNSPNASQFLFHVKKGDRLSDHTSKTGILHRRTSRNWTDASSTKPKKQALQKNFTMVRRKST